MGQDQRHFVVWHLPEGRLAHRQYWTDGYAAGFLDDRALLTVSGEQGLQVWTHSGPAESWQVFAQRPFVPSDDHFTWAALSRDRRELVARCGGSGAVYDLSFLGHGPQTPSDGNRAGPGLHPELAPLAPRLRLEGQPLYSRAEFSPNGQWIVSGYRNLEGDFGSALWFWSVQDGRPVHQIPSGNCEPRFSPDGRWFLLAGSPEYRLYAVDGAPEQWREVWREPREVFSFTAGPACFAAHQDWVALLADERIIRLLEITSRRELVRLTPLTPRVEDLAWSADGRWLAASSEFGTHLWDLPLLRARLRELGLDWE
jgi:WD40 repeat protein